MKHIYINVKLWKNINNDMTDMLYETAMKLLCSRIILSENAFDRRPEENKNVLSLFYYLFCFCILENIKLLFHNDILTVKKFVFH